ncbi:MAG: hypothetical protein HYX27_04900 [Acidobacteria bacterium]|nr:hypothetical protein [Acidobacteriota bacterium]
MAMMAASAEAADSRPFQITLESIPGNRPMLRAKIRNVAKKAELYLHDTQIQPSRLILRDAANKAIEPEDMRAVEKFSNAAGIEMFHKLNPGETRELLTATISTRLQWGPFNFPNLPPGRYMAKLEWESVRNPDPGPAPHPPIWKGKLTSNEVKFLLPVHP